jgi:hypothetical protein
MRGETNIKELYVCEVPFSIIKAEEITGTVYSVIYRDLGLRTRELRKDELNYFFRIQNKAKRIDYGYDGTIYEYFKFRSKLDSTVRAQFIEGIRVGRK